MNICAGPKKFADISRARRIILAMISPRDAAYAPLLLRGGNPLGVAI